MFCVNCGAQLPENSRFCNICGTDLSTRIAPPAQGAATGGGYSQVPPGGYAQPGGFGAAQGYPQQGGFAGQQSYPPQGYGQPGGFGAPQGYPQQSFGQMGGYAQPMDQGQPRGFVPPEPTGAPQGFVNSNINNPVMDAGKMTFYSSEKAMVVGGTGKMKIYPNRIEYKLISGSQAGFALGPLIGGALASKSKGKVEEYYFDQIKDVRIAKHMGMMSKVVIEFTNGKTCAFMPMEKGSKSNEHAEKICSTIRQYLR